MKIRIGDTVKVNTGKDKGKTGKVRKVLSKQNLVFVEGINLYKKHNKKAAGGGIIEKNIPLAYSKVNLLCPKCNQPTRIGINIGSTSVKVRICRKCKQPID